MSGLNSLNPLDRLTARINAEVIHAIALHSVWSTCIDLRHEFAVPLLLRNSVQIELLITLCRLYDKPQNNFTIPGVLGLLDKPTERHKLYSHDCAESARKSFGDLEKIDVLTRVRDLRDRVLAHNDRRPLKYLVQHGDETALLEHTILIAGLLHQAVTGNQPQFSEDGITWIEMANDFWRWVQQSTAANN